MTKSKKYPARPIEVVLFIAGYDTGGQGYRIKRAFDKYYSEEFHVRSVHTQSTYSHFPHDLEYRARDIVDLMAKADVLHMRNGFEDLGRLRPGALEPSSPTGLVLHYHGTKFRANHATMAPAAAGLGAVQIASTIDLTMLEPGILWCPAPFDIVEIGAYRLVAEARGGQPIRAAHAPTDRYVKSTKKIMDAVSHLFHERHLSIELDLIERKSWDEVLRRKAASDIYIDQLRLGYGNNAVEAWCMGLPVVAGLDDPAVRSQMLKTFKTGSLPFYEANEVNLAARLAALVTDADLRLYWGQAGLAHVMKFHYDRYVADLLAGVYREALDRKRSA